MYIGAIAYNPTDQPVTIDTLLGASYLSQPDASFYDAPNYSLNNDGAMYRGPGDRAMLDILRGRRQDIFPAQIVIPPKQSRMLMNMGDRAYLGYAAMARFMSQRWLSMLDLTLMELNVLPISKNGKTSSRMEN